MATATYRGIDLFGPQVTTQHQPHPVSEQMGAYPGLNGMQRLFLGTRGRTLNVRCCLTASSPAGLDQAEQAILAYAADGLAGDFTTERGTTYNNVVCTSDGGFEGDMAFLPGGLVCQWYRIKFVGLT